MKEWVKQLNYFGKNSIPIAFFISFDCQHAQIIPVDQLIQHNIYIQFPKLNMAQTHAVRTSITLDKNILDKQAYKKAFCQVQKHLHRGDSYLINLTSQTPITLDASLQEVYTMAHAKYKILFKDEWVCFSPETFVQIQDNIIRTFPMKGTIDASEPDAAQKLRTDKKEVAEHHTVVDLLRNDLSQVARKVSVEKLMYLEEIATQNKNILQMSSEISGEMEEDWQQHLGDIFSALLPAGSISGAPKNKTIQIIQNTETYDRGYYTGIAGVYDGQSVDSCVLIRFIENTHKGLVYKSGGGITAMSNLEEEYQELNHKIYVPIC